MKKAILTIAALAILTIANANAQRGHYPSKSSAPTPQVENHRLDNAIENFQINKLDNIVGLTHKQEHELKKIENRYDRLMKNRRLSYRDTQRLEQEKQHEIWSVLTPVQRQRLMAYQQSKKFDRNPSRRG